MAAWLGLAWLWLGCGSCLAAAWLLCGLAVAAAGLCVYLLYRIMLLYVAGRKAGRLGGQRRKQRESGHPTRHALEEAFVQLGGPLCKGLLLQLTDRVELCGDVVGHQQ